MKRIAVGVVIVVVAIGLPLGPAQAARDDALREVASRRVLFGHQSVGWNILDGMNAVYSGRGIPAPEIVDGVSELPASGPGFAQMEIGSNGDPASKFADFAAAVETASDLDVAVMKLCFVDITSGSKVRAVFAKYRAMVTQLRARHPRTTLVHVTVPLTTDDPASNVARQRYNALLRRTYGADLVDLARVESTRPDGSRVAGRHHGHRYYALFRGYAADEGHLNTRGAKRVAVAFVNGLAPARGDRRGGGTFYGRYPDSACSNCGRSPNGRAIRVSTPASA